MRSIIFFTLLFFLVFSEIFAESITDKPEFKPGNKILAWVPPSNSTIDPDEWPLVGWIEYKKIKFGIFAKHVMGFNSATGKGRFEVWISATPDFIEQIEKNHPYGPTDALAYLRQTGSTSMSAVLKKGNNSSPPYGYIPWTDKTNKLLLTVIETQNGTSSAANAGIYEVFLGGTDGTSIAKIEIECLCPDYRNGKSKPSDKFWIAHYDSETKASTKIDQRGLPGNSPITHDDPTTSQAGATPGGMFSTPNVQPAPEGSYVKKEFDTLNLNNSNRLKDGDKIVGFVPPSGSVPKTEQWPIVGWYDYKGVMFAVYAKHKGAYDANSGTGLFEVWISAPPGFINLIERVRGWGPEDAKGYLGNTGMNSMYAVYKPDGKNEWVTPPGSIPWTDNTDRLLIGVFRAPSGGISPDSVGQFEIRMGSADGPKFIGLKIVSQCPDYKNGKKKPDGEEWIYISRTGLDKKIKIDQWGLPGNTPVE